MKWEWKGLRLAHPVTIARRLAALPVLRLAQMVVFVAIWFGWGLDHAIDAWENKD